MGRDDSDPSFILLMACVAGTGAADGDREIFFGYGARWFPSAEGLRPLLEPLRLVAILPRVLESWRVSCVKVKG